MAIELPDELVWVMDLIGINWPQVNEDSVRQFAGQVRQFAGNIDTTHQGATTTIRQMAQHYEASSYTQLVERGTAMSSDHMTEVIQVCGAVALALEVAADAIVVAKTAVLTDDFTALEAKEKRVVWQALAKANDFERAHTLAEATGETPGQFAVCTCWRAGTESGETSAAARTCCWRRTAGGGRTPSGTRFRTLPFCSPPCDWSRPSGYASIT